MSVTLVSGPVSGSWVNTIVINYATGTAVYNPGAEASETIPVLTEFATFKGDCDKDSTANLAFTASGLPPGISVKPLGGGKVALEGTPEDSIIADNGISYYTTPAAKTNTTFTKVYNVKVTASNKCGSTSASFQLTILKNWDNDQNALLKFVEDTYG